MLDLVQILPYLSTSIKTSEKKFGYLIKTV